MHVGGSPGDVAAMVADALQLGDDLQAGGDEAQIPRRWCPQGQQVDAEPLLLAVRPEIILMDEPCSALDPIATARVEELILELKREFTIVIVTHNMQQAARVSDHTAFFWMGKLIETGLTEKMFTNPGHRMTEDYITGRFG